MGKLFIQDLKIETVIGCLAWERHIKQPVLLNLEIEYDTKTVVEADSLTHGLDYALIADAVTKFIEKSEYRMIETLAEKTTELISQQFPVKNFCLRLTKPNAIANANGIHIIIEHQI